MPNKPIIFPIGVAPLGAEFDPFFPILNCVRVVTMHLLEAFKNNVFGFGLDPVAIVPKPCLELYRKYRKHALEGRQHALGALQDTKDIPS